MDGRSFDEAIRRLTTALSRRGLWGAVTVAAFGVAASRLPGEVAASERKKRRRKGNKGKLQRNAFGCVDVSQPCRGNSANCCSGICQGKKPKKGQKDKSRCLAHDTGECQAEQDSCAINKGILCPAGDGVCLRTTGNASFCGDFENSACFACTKDTDCEADFGAGAACVVCAVDCEETENRVCVPAAA